VDDRLIVIPGDIYASETKYLEQTKQNYNPKDVLYIPRYNRTFLVHKEQMEACTVMKRLMGKHSIKEIIEHNFDMKDEFSYNECDFGKLIDCGYLNLLSLIYAIEFHESQELIVMIDLIELHLHELIRERIIKFLLYFTKIKKLYVTTYSATIIKTYSMNIDKNYV
jgi:predicted ATP-dependent endonuclease of OLD family